MIDTPEKLALLILGEEEYNNSPCQAHPYELVVHRVRQLEAQLDRYRNGYQGSCYACEEVALQNQQLREQIFEATKTLKTLEDIAFLVPVIGPVNAVQTTIDAAKKALTGEE